jgi:hypothetical protein
MGAVRRSDQSQVSAFLLGVPDNGIMGLREWSWFVPRREFAEKEKSS